MDEYIKRQAALDALQAPEIFNINPRHIELIKNIPAADVAPVVQCKDCVYAGLFKGTECLYCSNLDGLCNYVADDDYCSYGERKDEEI